MNDYRFVATERLDIAYLEWNPQGNGHPATRLARQSLVAGRRRATACRPGLSQPAVQGQAQDHSSQKGCSP